MPTLKAVIFDIDGVLLDSKEGNYIYLSDICKILGLKAPSKKEHHSKFYFRPIRESVKIISKIEDLAKIERMLLPVRVKLTRHLKLYKLFENSNMVLKKLSKTYKLGIASSRTKLGLEHYFKFSKTKKFFKAAVALDHVKNHKPHPEPLLLACKKLRVKPAEAVYIGDAPTDFLSAKAAGLKIIMYGSQKPKGADAYVKHYDKLIPAINKLKYGQKYFSKSKTFK